MSSSEFEDDASLPSAQPREEIIPETQDDLLYETQAGSSLGTEAEDYGHDANDGYLSDPPDPDRPNRLDGKTFRTRFAEELELSDSLNSMRARDLATHLYNVFQLRERAKRLRMESTEKAWGPPQDWTAWPAPAAQVPREREEEAYTHDHPWTLCGKPSSSREFLEDNLIAATAKRARENFARRQWASSSESSATAPSAENELDIEVVNDTKLQSETWTADVIAQTRKQSSTTPKNPTPSGTAVDLSDALSELSSEAVSSDAGNARTDKVSTTKKKPISTGLHAINITDTPKTVANQPFLVEEAKLYSSPMTDDDHIRALLQRPTRHTLVKFDDLLAAMHHSRASYIRQRNSQKPPVSSSRAISQSIVEAAQRANDNKIRQELQHFRLRDWSNILGFAALAGWDENVVQRARVRCERLFGQRMDFVTSVGGSRKIPAESSSRSTAISPTQDTAMQNTEEEAAGQEALIYLEEQKLPLDNSSAAANAHGLDQGPSTNLERRSEQSPTKERPELMLRDGLHADGFLKPIKLRWKAKYNHLELPRWWTEPPSMETPEPESGDSTDSEAEQFSDAAIEDPLEDDIPMPDEPDNVPIDPALLSIDPQLLDPSLNAHSLTVAAPPASTSRTPASVPTPARISDEEEPVAGPSNKPQSSPSPPPQPSPLKLKEGLPSKPASEKKPRKSRAKPPHLLQKAGPKKVQGPKAPKRLKPTLYPRTPEQLDYWRSRGFVE